MDTARLAGAGMKRRGRREGVWGREGGNECGEEERENVYGEGKGEKPTAKCWEVIQMESY